MNWVIFLLIAFITTIIALGTCGVGGGFMMLVALNGFSESEGDTYSHYFRAYRDRNQHRTFHSRKLDLRKIPSRRNYCWILACGGN